MEKWMDRRFVKTGHFQQYLIFTIELGNCSDSVVLFVFHFISEFEEMISFVCFRLIEINVYKDV
jgi:hypothetical protein